LTSFMIVKYKLTMDSTTFQEESPPLPEQPPAFSYAAA